MTSRDYLSVANTAPTLRVSLAIALSVVVVGSLPSALAHAQEPAIDEASTASAEIVRIHVVFMAAVEKDEVAEFEAEFHERQFPQFANDEGLLEVGSDGEPELILRLQIVQLDKGVNNYVVGSTAIYHDQVHMESRRACLGCTPAEVVADALSNVKRAATAVVEHRAELTPDEAPTPIQPAPAVEPQVRVLGPASYVGISANALGLGAVIAGAVLFDRGRVIESAPGMDTEEGTDYRPVGAAWLGVGAGAIVVGAVLLGVDLGVLLPRRRERARARGRWDLGDAREARGICHGAVLIARQFECRIYAPMYSPYHMRRRLRARQACLVLPGATHSRNGACTSDEADVGDAQDRSDSSLRWGARGHP